MEQLKMMKEQLISIVQSQLGNIQSVDSKELGEVIDMIKDLSEAAYYCTITEAMEEEGQRKGYEIPFEDYNAGKMYYGGQNGGSSSSGGQTTNYYTPNRVNPVYYSHGIARESEYTPEYMMPHDYREGRARVSRKMYMESKQMNKDPNTQMKELEQYIHDLGEDVTEMIANATPEEKLMLQQKIAMLSTKIK